MQMTSDRILKVINVYNGSSDEWAKKYWKGVLVSLIETLLIETNQLQ